MITEVRWRWGVYSWNIRGRQPKWQKEKWKCPFKSSRGLALTSPEGQKTGVNNNILWQPPCQGMSISGRTVCHPQTKVGRRQRLFIESMQRQWRLWGERKWEVGRTFTKSPRLLALSVSNTLTSSSTKCYWKGKMPNVFKSSPRLCPTCCITLLDVHGRAQRPHYWRKKTKNKLCCSLQREEGVEGCWDISHGGLCSVKQLPSSSLAQF